MLVANKQNYSFDMDGTGGERQILALSGRNFQRLPEFRASDNCSQFLMPPDRGVTGGL